MITLSRVLRVNSTLSCSAMDFMGKGRKKRDVALTRDRKNENLGKEEYVFV